MQKTSFRYFPMEIDESKTARLRWANKPVIESVLLDNMEEGASWQHIGVGEMTFTNERSLDGDKCLRLTSKTKREIYIDPEDRANYGRPFGEAVVRRVFNGENWSSYNRVSFWVYPTLPGFRVISMYAVLRNDGEIKIPDSYEREGLHFFLLKPDQWNNVVWEIASLPRDKVVGVDIIYRMQGNEPGATDTVIFDIDKLELQKVEADHYEGWNVAPGHISFSHTGYQTGTVKNAIASDIKASEFSIINIDTNKIILTKPIEIKKSNIGEFQLMDFSEIEADGSYIIKAGDVETQSFRIDRNVWRGTIWKTINHFFCQRCGFNVPTIHGNCHRDWQCSNGEQKIIINGGWHDAGDLSQGLWNTTEATYAMFHLARNVRLSDPELYERLLEEGKWGLDWVLKTRFGDGNRSVWATMDFWTDGIIGTHDDITFKALNIPFANFDTAAAEALAAMVLKDEDPILSSYCLKAAKEDWQFAVDILSDTNYSEAYRHFPDVQLNGTGALASVELYRATGYSKYAEKAFEQAKVIMNCQQTMAPDRDIPLTGFFYENADRDRILHYLHLSQSQAPLVALAELITEFTDHSNWGDWYRCIALYSDYLMKITEYTKPYGMFPASIYRIDESGSDVSDLPTYKEQVESGIRLSDEYYLRLFPVWFVFRGNNSLLLSDAKALSSIARIRRNVGFLDLCNNQLQWVVGRNPFSQSLMYGEGYDYAPQYTAMSGDIVGSLPVGIQTSREKDIPYWPVNNCYNYKEVWVHPSGRWLWLMSDLAGTAKVSGSINPDNGKEIEFLNNVTGKAVTIEACGDSGEFIVELSQGQYTVRHNGFKKSISIVPGETYKLDLKKFYSIRKKSTTVEGNKLSVELEIVSNCIVKLDLRCSNISLEKNKVEISTTNGNSTTVTIHGSIINKNEEYIAVIVPNGNFKELVEV